MAKTKTIFNESRYHVIEAYIESGSTTELSEDEVQYLDVLCKMNSMRRKYGIRQTISFFTNAPFKIPSFRAKQMYYESVNLFYAEEQADKQALRNMKAEQLEMAAELVMKTSKSPKDLEIYGNLIIQSAKIRQLDVVDPPQLPEGAYKRHTKIYSLNPNVISLEVGDRNELAREIDALDIPEKDKRRVKSDALIETVDFVEVLNEQKKENSKG